MATSTAEDMRKTVLITGYVKLFLQSLYRTILDAASAPSHPVHPLHASRAGAYSLQCQRSGLRHGHARRPSAMTSPDSSRTSSLTGRGLSSPSCSPGGIGHSLALAFHAHNLRVFATARSTSSLATLAAKGIETFPLTVDSEESIASLLRTLTPLLHGRGLDYLVNNAGVNHTVPALDIDPSLAAVRAVFETNVFAVMRLCQVFAPQLIAAQGTVVMIGSLAGVMPYVFGSVYNASKAALHAYANTLRVEMAPLGVSVVTVVTGGVQSRIARTARLLPDDSRYAPVEEEYQTRLTHSQMGAMPNQAFAESVVRQVLPGAGPWPWRWLLKDARKRWIWEGNKSWLIWFLAGGWTWSGVFDWYFTRAFGLWKIRQTKSKRA